MTEKINLTMASVDRIEPLKTGRRWVYDTKIPGMVLLVTAAGAKSWYVYKKIAGRPVRYHLGKFPSMSVDAARDQAQKLLVSIAEGQNPSEVKRKQRGELTLGGLFRLFLEYHAEVHKKAGSIADDKGMWNRYLLRWEHRKLSSITHAEVHALHSKIGKVNGKVAANRTLSMLSKMFSVAKSHGEFRNKPNPCEGVKRFAEKSRDRFLQPDELPRFLAALNAEPNQQAADALRLMLLTGARKSNVLSMRWADIDLAAARWRILDTKNGDPQTVPLVPQAVEVLTALKTRSTSEVYVFPSRFAGSTYGHMTDITKPWRSITERAGLPGVRMHDLRRTMGSWQALQGTSLITIGKSLGHRNASTTEIYARLSLDPVRAAMEKASAAMLATTKPAAQPAVDDGPVGVG